MRVCLSHISVIGPIWWPTGAVCSLEFPLGPFEIQQIRDYGDGEITRDGVEDWLGCHSGDFQSVTDFYADISDGDEDYLFDWSDPASEVTYMDTISDYGEED